MPNQYFLPSILFLGVGDADILGYLSVFFFLCAFKKSLKCLRETILLCVRIQFKIRPTSTFCSNTMIIWQNLILVTKFAVIIPIFADPVSQLPIHNIWQLFKLQMRIIIDQDYQLFYSIYQNSLNCFGSHINQQSLVKHCFISKTC